MIAEAPVAAAAGLDTIAAKLSAFVAAAKSASAGGITWAEFGELMLALVRLAVEALDVFASVPGPEKKAIVLEAVGDLFDAVADKCVPMALLPIWWLARPAVRALVISLASGAVEQILPMVRASA